jgi:hypothetical protein
MPEMVGWDTSDYEPEDLTVEAVVDMVKGCGDYEDQVAVTDHKGNALRVLGVRSHDYRVEIVTDVPGRKPYVQDDTTEDDRPAPRGEANDARLERWVRENVPDRRIRRSGIDPVTLTGGEIFDLLFEVAESFYGRGGADYQAADERDPMRRVSAILRAKGLL